MSAIGEWINALVGVGTLALAVAAFEGNRLSQKSRDEERRRHEREQAEQVAAWFVEGGHPDLTPRKAILSNASLLPIHYVIMIPRSSNGQPIARPDSQVELKRYYLSVPHGDHDLKLTAPGVSFRGSINVIDLVFTDAKNKTWTRFDQEGLKEAPKDWETRYGPSKTEDWTEFSERFP